MDKADRYLLSQYNVVSLVFSWFALANIWLTFSIVIDLLPSQGLILFGTTAVVSIHVIMHIYVWFSTLR